MACKQCELSRVKGTLVTRCGARNTVVEVDNTKSPIEYLRTIEDIEEISQTELLSEITDIDNEEAE